MVLSAVSYKPGDTDSDNLWGSKFHPYHVSACPYFTLLESYGVLFLPEVEPGKDLM